MLVLLRTVGWITCIVYSTIPAFWLLIHPRAELWRARRASPYKILVPTWMFMWVALAVATDRWRSFVLYKLSSTWIPATLLFCTGLLLYKLSHQQFTLAQLGGLPEVLRDATRQCLVTTGIRSHVRHPVYLAHLCGMLAWSTGTGLAVCWALTAFAILTGGIMIKMEDKELERRFGEEYRTYRSTVPAVLPRITI
jgi:protein-S-isoprenylcysteine O-methyltransferase Ste14